MTNSSLAWVRWGSLLMFIAVALGAFGAHGLKHRLSSEMLAVFETGVRYQIYHSLGLFIVAWLFTLNATPSFCLKLAGPMFLIGIALFSGSLYLLTLTGLRWWGLVTPLGGLLFLSGWTFLFLSLRTK